MRGKQRQPLWGERQNESRGRLREVAEENETKRDERDDLHCAVFSHSCHERHRRGLLQGRCQLARTITPRLRHDHAAHPNTLGEHCQGEKKKKKLQLSTFMCIFPPRWMKPFSSLRRNHNISRYQQTSRIYITPHIHTPACAFSNILKASFNLFIYFLFLKGSFKIDLNHEGGRLDAISDVIKGKLAFGRFFFFFFSWRKKEKNTNKTHGE